MPLRMRLVVLLRIRMVVLLRMGPLRMGPLRMGPLRMRFVPVPLRMRFVLGLVPVLLRLVVGLLRLVVGLLRFVRLSNGLSAFLFLKPSIYILLLFIRRGDHLFRINCSECHGAHNSNHHIPDKHHENQTNKNFHELFDDIHIH